jgi:hydroxyacylglutathione hydrolase
MIGSPVVGLVDEGLGNSTYLVGLGDGRALVVDASRDLRAVRAAATTLGLLIAFAADTHLHADFLSGSSQLAATDGATILASAAGGRAFAHTALADGDEVDLGGLWLRALTTPGHTDEHVSFLLLDDGQSLGVFSGGSLIVNAAARTDLVDPARTEELARAQYQSLRRLAALPDETALWPTHGAGSFCSAPPGSSRTSTIGAEKTHNPLLQAVDEDAFVAALLGSLGTFPPYFSRLGELNRLGPPLLGDSLGLPAVDPAQAKTLLDAGARLVDVRPVTDYAAGHVTGALSIPLRDVFATWLGWVAPHDRPLIVMRRPDQDIEEILWQAAKIGYDNLVAELADDLFAAAAAGLDTTRTQLVDAAHLDGFTVVDIRQHAEFAAGHIPGAQNVELGNVGEAAAELPAGPMAVMCGHGERGATAASILERTGRADVTVFVGGPDDWVAEHHAPLATK